MLEHHNDDYPALVLHNPDTLWNLEKLAIICRNWKVASHPAGQNATDQAQTSLSELILGTPGGDDRLSLERARRILEELAYEYHHAKESDGELPPLQAFLLAWLRQQEEPISMLNAFPALHRHLYYQDYLGLSPKGAVADKVLLVLNPDRNLPQVSVPAGTLFDGGQDVNGTPLHYALDNRLWLNRGQLSDIMVKTEHFTVLQNLPDIPFIPGKSPGFQDIADITSAKTCELFLGFSDLDVNQTISLFWKIQAHQSPEIKWEYMNKGKLWASLTFAISDDTLQLSRPGLWSFTLPADAIMTPSATITSEPDNLSKTPKYWLKATFMKPETRKDFHLDGLYVNAMTATLQHPEQIDTTHFLHALLAESVSQPVEHVEGLIGLQQPIPSFGGIAPESDATFNQRIAERLHHRQRAITLTDIKSLLKSRFPEIQAIATGLSSRAGQQLIVIPVPHERDNSASPKEPKFNSQRLGHMANYIKTLSSDRLTLTIDNPRYVPLVVSYKVTYQEGVAAEWGDNLLLQALNKRFMPWTQPEGTARVTLGESLNYFDIIAYIESQEYVEKVDDMNMAYEAGDKNTAARASPFIITPAPGEVLSVTFTNNAEKAKSA